MAPVALSALQLERGWEILSHGAASGSCHGVGEHMLCAGGMVLVVDVLSAFPPGLPLRPQGRRAGEGVLQVLPPLPGGCGSLGELARGYLRRCPSPWGAGRMVWGEGEPTST